MICVCVGTPRCLNTLSTDHGVRRNGEEVVYNPGRKSDCADNAVEANL